jgi:hypothetical protein
MAGEVEIGLFVLALVTGVSGLLFGKWSDIFWRAKIKRNNLKEEVVIVGKLNKDRKTLRLVDVAPNYGVVRVGEYLWIYDGAKAWRAYVELNENRIMTVQKRFAPKFIELSIGEKMAITEQLGRGKKVQAIPESAITHQTEKVFLVKEDNIKWNEGVPIIFVDEEHLTPINFESTTPEANAVEISGWLNSYIENEKRKDTKKKQGMDLMQILVILLIVGCLGLSYMNYTEIQSIKAGVISVQTPVVVNTTSTEAPLPPNSHIENGVLVVGSG